MTLMTILLWLFVIVLSISFGAGLYESRVVVPQWLSYSSASIYQWNAELARRTDPGLKFWVYVTTVPLTLLTLVSLIAFWWTVEPIRTWWLIAALAALVDRVLTLSYFIPTMVKLMNNKTFSEAQAVAKARQWVGVNFIRHAATLVAWLAGLRALTLLV